MGNIVVGGLIEMPAGMSKLRQRFHTDKFSARLYSPEVLGVVSVHVDTVVL